MKNYFIYRTSIFLFCLFLIACNKDDSVNPNLDSNEVNLVTSLPFITPFDLNLKNQIEKNFITSKTGSNLKTLAWEEIGPINQPGTLTRIRKNLKLSVINQPGWVSGVYFCDVYSMSATVELEPGQIMMFEGASKTGYANYTTFTPGVINTQLGNQYTFTTYSVVPRYNSGGTQVSGPTLPTDLTGTYFTYSYLVNN